MTDIEKIKEIEKDYPYKGFYILDDNNNITSLFWDFSFDKIQINEFKLNKIENFIGLNGKINDYIFLSKTLTIKNITIAKSYNKELNITWDEISHFLTNFNKLSSINIVPNKFETIPSLNFFKEIARLNLNYNNRGTAALHNEFIIFINKNINVKHIFNIVKSMFNSGCNCYSDFFYTSKIGINDTNLYLNTYNLFEKKSNTNITNQEFSKKCIDELNKINPKEISIQKNYTNLSSCLTKFYIHNFNEIKKLYINGIPKNTQWIFITGENGYGKTSILQAIAIGIFGKNEDEGLLLDKKSEIRGFVIISRDEEKTDSYKFFNTFENRYEELNKEFTGKIENFAFYGPSRLKISSDRKSQTYSLFHNDGTLLDIEAKFREWYNTEFLHLVYEKVKKVFLKLLAPYIDDIKVEIDIEKSTKTVKYHEKDSSEYIWLTYDELASGYKSIIATFGDMIIRLTEGNKSSEIEDLSGIVIIDEFDIHLHPKWQKELVEKLTKVFPNVQFIVSTHSPIPILGAPENSIIINVDRDKENGITAKILDVDFKNLTPNSILTSPIFDFRSIIPESNKNLKDLQTNDDYDEILFQKKEKQKLVDFVAEDNVDYNADKH